MRIRIRLTIVALCLGLMAVLAAGCQRSLPAKAQLEKSESESSPPASEIQNLAEKALGPGAEIVAHGNLARNGVEQLLVIRQLKKVATADAGTRDNARLFITQAVVLEKNGQRWSEVLRCDERVKNSKGYLGGAQAVSARGWLLQFAPNTPQGLRLEFTPAAAAETQELLAHPNMKSAETVTVRWNAEAKLYQALDRTNNRYLSELPTLETPQSIIR